MRYDNHKTAFTGLGPGHMVPRRRAKATQSHRDGASPLARAARRIVGHFRRQRELSDHRPDDLKLTRPGIASLKRPHRS
jgi:hypothetical protein